MLKNFRHTQLNLALLKWQLCQLRHTFYLVPVHLPLMSASFSLCHCAHIGPEKDTSEFNKLRYYFKSPVSSLDTYKELITAHHNILSKRYIDKVGYL